MGNAYSYFGLDDPNDTSNDSSKTDKHSAYDYFGLSAPPLPTQTTPPTPITDNTIPAPTQPNIFQSILGGVKWYATHPGQLLSEIGQGLASGLSKTGTFQNNLNIAKSNAESSIPLFSNQGKKDLASLQIQQDYVNSHPVNTVPATLGEQIPEIPLWMAGEGAVTKLAPKLLPKLLAEKVAPKIPSFITEGLKDAATYGTVVAPTEVIRDSQSQLPSEPNYGMGNIDLNHRPVIHNPDGSISTVRSISIDGDNGQSILIPTVRQGLDRIMTNDEAIAWYKKTGENLGTFANEDQANKYAESLHQDQAKLYDKPSFLQNLLEKEKQLPSVALGGIAFRGAGKAFDAGLNMANPLRKIVPDIKQAELATDTRLQNPTQIPTEQPQTLSEYLSGVKQPELSLQSSPILQDVQNAYKAPILRDVQVQQLKNTLADTTNNLGVTGPTLTKQGMTDAELLLQKQMDAQDVFGKPLNNYKVKQTITPEQKAYEAKQSELASAFQNQPIGSVNTPLTLNTLQKNIDNSLGIGKQAGIAQDELQNAFPSRKLGQYSFTTNEQRAMDELTQGMQTAQNYVKHNDVLAAYPPGTTIEQAYADVKANTGVDIPKLTDNLVHAQNVKTTLTPEELRLGKVSGVIPSLKPRETSATNLQPIIETPQKLGLSGTLPVNAPIQPQIRPNVQLKPRELKPIVNAQARIFPEPTKPLTWTNRDNISSAGPAPIRSITEQNLGQLPRDTQRIMPVQQVAAPIGEPTVKSVAANIEKPNAINEPISYTLTQGAKPKISQPFDPNAPLPEPQSKIIIGKQKEPFNFKNAWDKFYTGVVDKQKPLMDLEKTAGTDIGKLASNTRNTSGIVDYNILNGLVDKNGNRVGDSLKNVVEAIPKGQEKDFWTYMSQRHNIDRAREGKSVQANYTPEMSTEAVKQIEQSHPEYKAIGDNITNWIDKFMTTWGVDTGIVNKDIYDGLRQTYPSYFPTQRNFSTLEKAIPDNVSQKFADQRTPIRKATGSERDIVNPVENIMNLVNRTVRVAKFNEVGQSLLDTVRSNPEKMKPFAEVIPAKDGMFANTDNVISVLENGKPTYLKINDKPLLDAMNGLPKSVGELPFKLGKPIQLYKDLITQKNPLFAIRNIFRDMPTAYAYGSENNPLKFTAELVGAGKDILTNSPRLQRYQAIGGGGANFFNPSDVAKSASELSGSTNKIKGLALKPIKAIETFNNLTETAPRLAEFNRVLDKTGDVTKALAAANDVTVNFSRSGNITKVADKAVPYLNAGVQGLDKFFRGFVNPKAAVATLAKSGVAITAPTIALYLVNKDNPHFVGGVDSKGNPIAGLDNRTKDTYFNLPNYLGKIDDRGYPETFIKIPKSRELGVLFSSLFERVARQAEGQQEAFKGFGNTVATNFFVQNPITQHIAAPMAYNLPTNKDFANRAIVPQSMIVDKRSPYLQYDDKTTEISKWFANLIKDAPIPQAVKDVIGSPKRLDYLVKSYSGVVGQFGIPLTTPGGSPGKTLATQFISDPVFSNQVTTDFYDKLDKLSSAATDKNILQKIPSKTLTPEENIRNSMNGVSSALSRGTKLINSIQASSDPLKDDKIKEIKTQMLSLTSKAVYANDPKSMQTVENAAKKMFTK